jgi:hypothetical protein
MGDFDAETRALGNAHTPVLVLDRVGQDSLPERTLGAIEFEDWFTGIEESSSVNPIRSE